MGRSQVLFNQRKGRGRGRGSGRTPGRFDAEEAKRRANRPKWGTGNNEDDEDKIEDTYESEAKLDDELSLLEANVSSQRYIMPSKKDEPEAETLALDLFHTDSGKLREQMNYALKHLSLEDRFRIPFRLISTITDDEPDISDESSTVVSSLTSATMKLRVSNVLNDPVASRLGIQNLPAKPKQAVQADVPPPKKSGACVPSWGKPKHGCNFVKTAEDTDYKESNEINMSIESLHRIESSGVFIANQEEEEEDPAADLIMRLRSLPSQDQNEIPRVASSKEDDIDEWLKDTLSSDPASANRKSEAIDLEEEMLDEEHLEDWLDSII